MKLILQSSFLMEVIDTQASNHDIADIKLETQVICLRNKYKESFYLRVETLPLETLTYTPILIWMWGHLLKTKSNDYFLLITSLTLVAETGQEIVYQKRKKLKPSNHF